MEMFMLNGRENLGFASTQYHEPDAVNTTRAMLINHLHIVVVAASPYAPKAMRAKPETRSCSVIAHFVLLVFVVFARVILRLSVGLLVAGTGTWTAELLGLASSVVGDEECAVVGDKGLLQLVLAVLVDVLLVVCNLRGGLVLAGENSRARLFRLRVG